MEAIENFIEDIPPHLALKFASTLALHPLEVAKVLIQIGHEPIAPVNKKNLWGKPVLRLPSVFQYMAHIKRKEGMLGLWRGCSPRLTSLLVQHYTAEKFDEICPPEPELTEDEESKLSDEEKVKRCARETARCLANKTVCVIISHPLQVVMVRAIAEFVNSNEHGYTGDITGGIFSGIVTSIKENGILSLWSGVQPRLVGELLLVTVTSALQFTFNTYVLKKDNKEMKRFSDQIASYLASSMAYPFTVVSNCMIVSRSGLTAGYPPCMPLYINWVDCYRHLRSQNQLKRGSSLFFRTYTGPQVMVGDKMIPASSLKFKAPAALGKEL